MIALNTYLKTYRCVHATQVLRRIEASDVEEKLIFDI